MQLKDKAQKGALLADLDEHIAELKKHLEADQSADDKLLETELARLNSEISGLENEVQEFERQLEFLQKKLDVLKEQSEVIDNIFAADSEAYYERIGAQNSMLATIEILLQKINDHLLEGHSLVQTDDLLKELKELGRGKHIEVLAQVPCARAPPSSPPTWTATKSTASSSCSRT